jgi:uncharacterized protein YbjT (DUF2867 family)
MADKKVIAVVGATGSQGGGLCEAILSDGEFACRAITRDPDKDKAKALAAKGAEVVAADLNDEASLTKAFAGAHGVYGVTNYWEIFDVAKEQQQATNIAKAAKAAGAKHVIWSTLEDTTKWVPLDDKRMPTLQGKYKCPHFDSKGQIDHVFTDLGLPVTFLLTSFYWDNFYLFGMWPKKGDDGTYALPFPIGNAKMPGIAAEDIGKCALGIFKKGSEFVGKRVGVAGEHLTGAEMAEKCSKVLGVKCVYGNVPPDTYRGFGFPGADDLGNMFQIYDLFEKPFGAVRSVEGSRALAPKLMNFEQWLTKNKSKITL